MKRRSSSVFLVIALVLILSTFATNAQQPRAVPPNDNFFSAQPIQLGKSYTVTDISAATNETGEPVASCRAGTVIPHSVWFAFTVPQPSRIYFTTFGSLLYGPNYYAIDTVLAVYELTAPGVFTERACVDDANGLTAAQLMVNVNAGTTYYVSAGTFAPDAFLPESTLKLNSRMLATMIFPPNYNFETPVDGTDWKVKNPTDDLPVCSNATYPPADGLCAFRFSGTPGVTTKLTQTIPFPAGFVPRKDALLSYVVYFRVLDAAALGPTKVRFIITYSNGALPTIHTLDLTGAVPTATYDVRTVPFLLKNSKVASIKFEVKFGASAGTLLVDYINYHYFADVSTRTGGLLPVPSAAAK